MGDSDWRLFVYGGFASCIAEFGTYPADTAKTRLQVQGQVLDANNNAKLKYRGMVDCFVQISRQEGFKSLYSGVFPAVLRQAVYGTVRYGTYYSLKQFIVEHYYDETVILNVCCGVLAGAVCSTVGNPTEVLKVRMQVRGRTGLVKCFKEIYMCEGISGFWKSVHLTAQRGAVMSAAELPIYDFCKSRLMNLFGDQFANHSISSSLSALGATIVSTPMDVVRTRLMNQRKIYKSGLFPPHIYKGTLDCTFQIFKKEGLWGFYKGFIPTLFRMGPWNIIFFIIYEQLKRVY